MYTPNVAPKSGKVVEAVSSSNHSERMRVLDQMSDGDWKFLHCPSNKGFFYSKTKESPHLPPPSGKTHFLGDFWGSNFFRCFAPKIVENPSGESLDPPSRPKILAPTVKYPNLQPWQGDSSHINAHSGHPPGANVPTGTVYEKGCDGRTTHRQYNPVPQRERGIE